MQGAQKLRSEAHLRVRRNDEVAAQRRRWTFYETIMVDDRAIEGQSISTANIGLWISLLQGCGRGDAEAPARTLVLMKDGLRPIFQKRFVIIVIICRSLPSGV